jgi:hypothetical protein
MVIQPDANIVNACRALFGQETCISPSFLMSLKPNTLKTAFRKKAKESHPDLFAAHGIHVQRTKAESFRAAAEAYDIMRRYCERRDRMRVHAHRRQSNAATRPVRPAPEPAATRTFRVDEQGWLYQGVVPERRLEIGRYLYYRGRIPYHVLLRALAWQMRQRPTLGAIAKSWGWLNDDQIRAILGLRSSGSVRFGQRALHLGLLSSYQARILLSYQRTLQKKLGLYFVERGHLTQAEMDGVVDDLNRHNARVPLSLVADWRKS